MNKFRKFTALTLAQMAARIGGFGLNAQRMIDVMDRNVSAPGRKLWTHDQNRIEAAALKRERRRLRAGGSSS